MCPLAIFLLYSHEGKNGSGFLSHHVKATARMHRLPGKWEKKGTKIHFGKKTSLQVQRDVLLWKLMSCHSDSPLYVPPTKVHSCPTATKGSVIVCGTQQVQGVELALRISQISNQAFSGYLLLHQLLTNWSDQFWQQNIDISQCLYLRDIVVVSLFCHKNSPNLAFLNGKTDMKEFIFVVRYHS